MAKSDSFFIRAQVNAKNDLSFNQVSVDLGAYVDALGKSVLRIHNIAVQVTDATGTTARMAAGGSNGEAKNGKAQFQLTTQTQGAMITGLDKSTIATGQLTAANLDNAVSFPSIVSESFDNLPQMWTNGYLVAVDTIYLGGSASDGFDEDVYFTLVMECTVETMTQAAAMALALSQQ
jgi:hypothetical protein|tara:strand:- start:1455 stop:1985 length:531 start_codon:yes stop_codon:yes gene_type:complete